MNGLPDFDAPAAHRVERKWKWLVALSALVLGALMAGTVVVLVQDHQAGTGWENVWLPGFVLATVGGLALLGLAAVAWAFRARVVLRGDAMILRGLLGTRVITVRDIEGYRWLDGQMNLVLRSDVMPLNLSYFDNQAILADWVLAHAPDQKAIELAAVEKEVKRQLPLGLTEAHKEARTEAQFARLRRLTRTLNWAAYGAAAAGLLNAFTIEDAVVQQVAAAVLAVLPVGMLLLAFGNPGSVRLDHHEGSRVPEVLTGILASSLALGLMSLLDPHTLLGDRFYWWVVPIAFVNGALWLSVELAMIRELYARRWPFAVIAVATYFFLSGFWVGGTVYQANQHFDASETAWSATVVAGKRTESRDTGTAYYLKVAPWDGAGGESLELHVTKERHDQLGIGAPVEVGVRRGALDMPWVVEVRARRP